MYLGMVEIHPGWARHRHSSPQRLFPPKYQIRSMYGIRPQCGMFPTWRSSSKFVNLTLSKSLIPGWIFKPKAATILRLCHPTQTKGGAKCETLTWGGREFFVSFRWPARRLNWHLLGKGGFKERDDQLESAPFWRDQSSFLHSTGSRKIWLSSTSWTMFQ